MDLEVVKPAIGGRYKPQWLPCLKVISKEQFVKAVKLFSEGDRVKIVATKPELRERQVGHGGWTESIAQVIMNQILQSSKFIINLFFIIIKGDWRGWHRF